MLNKNISLLLCMVFLFAFIPFVQSAPPVTSVQQFTEGLYLKYPSDQIIKQNMPYEFEVHVYNISNGMPITTGITCYFHLYNSTGKHQLELTDSTPSHVFDYSFNVLAGNFTEVGDYYYIVQCNSTSLGGFIEVAIEVTPNGLETSTGGAIIEVSLILVLLILLMSCVFIFMETDNLLARVGTLGFGYLLLIAITFISWNMASDFLLSAPFIAEMFRILFFVFVVGAFPLLIGAFAYYLIMIFKIKEIQRLMDHGMSENDAQRRVR